MNKIILYITLLLCFTSCKHDNDNPNKNSCQRTVLIYIAANNNLSGYSQLDIEEMRQGVISNGLNGGRLLIFNITRKQSPALYEMKDDGKMELLKEYGDNISSVDPGTLRQVCEDSRRIAPNSDYGLILWSHSSGWLSHTPSSPNRNSGMEYSWGMDGSQAMTIPQLREVLEGISFSFIYFDSCFMGNIESLYELRNNASAIVASPTEVLTEGMPYDKNIKCFFASPEADMVQAAKNTFNYYNSLNGADRSCTISVYNTSALEKLASVARNIMAANTKIPQGVELQQYGYNINGAYFDGYFYDMYQYLSSLCINNQQLTNELNDVWNNLTTFQAHTPLFWNRFSLDKTNGVSCFIYPDNEIIGAKYGYTELEWYTNVVLPSTK